MDPFIYQYVSQQPHLLIFIRENPVWYRYLSREPQMITDMEKAAKEYSGKTISKRLEKVGDQMQMISMLIQLAGAMKD